MPQNVKEKGPLNIDLQEAVKRLYAKGIIKKDKEIAQKTGFSTGQVSSYINGRAPMSPNFKNSFETIFKISLGDFSKESRGEEEQEKPINENAIYRDKYISRLEKENDFLQRLVESSLVEIVDRQRTLQAGVQAVHQWDSEVAAGGDKKKQAQHLKHILKLVSDNRERDVKMSKNPVEGK